MWVLETGASAAEIDRDLFIPSGIKFMPGPVLGDRDPEIKNRDVVVKKFTV